MQLIWSCIYLFILILKFSHAEEIPKFLSEDAKNVGSIESLGLDDLISTTPKPLPPDSVYTTNFDDPSQNYYLVKDKCWYTSWNTDEITCSLTSGGYRWYYHSVTSQTQPIKLNIEGLKMEVLKKGSILPQHDLTNVKVLVLEDTNTTTIEEGAFDAFHSLETLIIKGSFLSSVDAKVFSQGVPKRLVELNLQKNNITDFNFTIFENFTKLKTLNLAGNSLNLTKAIFPKSLDKLRKLNLGYCNISELRNDIFNNLTRLQELSLEGNPLMFIPAAINNLKALNYLDMDQTFIKIFHPNPNATSDSIEKMTFARMPNLTIIEADVFSNFPRLNEVSFAQSSDLYKISPKAFGYPEKKITINTLNLEGCDIAFLPEDLLDWHSLDTLYFADNPLWCTCANSWLIDDLRGNVSHHVDKFKVNGYSYGWKDNRLRCTGPPQYASKVVTELTDDYCDQPTAANATTPASLVIDESTAHLHHETTLLTVTVILFAVLVGVCVFIFVDRRQCRQGHVSIHQAGLQAIVIEDDALHEVDF